MTQRISHPMAPPTTQLMPQAPGYSGQIKNHQQPRGQLARPMTHHGLVPDHFMANGSLSSQPRAAIGVPAGHPMTQQPPPQAGPRMPHQQRPHHIVPQMSQQLDSSTNQQKQPCPLPAPQQAGHAASLAIRASPLRPNPQGWPPYARQAVSPLQDSGFQRPANMAQRHRVPEPSYRLACGSRMPQAGPDGSPQARSLPLFNSDSF